MPRRLSHFAVAASLALLGCAGPQHVQSPAPRSSLAPQAVAARGLDFAQKVCAECHAVTRAQAFSPNAAAPSFVAIANLPGLTPTALNAWLHSAHRTMPYVAVTPQDRADLFAYLQSLKTNGAAG